MDDHLSKRSQPDVLIWSDTQIALLRAGEFDQLDLEGVIAELELQVQEDKDEVSARLRGLMTNLLKYEFRPHRRLPHWGSLILEHRYEILAILKQMPSLRSQIDRYVALGYHKAVKAAAREAHMPPAIFPQENPYTVDQILDEDFFPGGNDNAVDSA
jgi:hypothetical protein